MSYSFVLTGNEPILTTEFNPPIYLDDDFQYVIGLVNFETFHSIPNIDKTNNKFIYNKDKHFLIPSGSYEIDDLNLFIKNKLAEENITFELSGNLNTLHTHITASAPITFQEGTIGKILGFKNQELDALIEHTSDFVAEIIKVNAINIDCNIAEGSYLNGEPVHIIHQFFPNVSPGYKIIEQPQNVIYFPVVVNTIDKIVVKIVDQDGKLVNFRKELVTLRLHLKKLDEKW